MAAGQGLAAMPAIVGAEGILGVLSTLSIKSPSGARRVGSGTLAMSDVAETGMPVELGKDAFLEGKELGVIGPPSKSGAEDKGNGPNVKSGFSLLLGSITVGGGVSRESINPIASIAPPSNSVRSVMVVDWVMAGEVRTGERVGRRGSDRTGDELSGEFGVLIILGSSLVGVRGETDRGVVARTFRDGFTGIPRLFDQYSTPAYRKECLLSTERTPWRWLRTPRQIWRSSLLK